MLTRMDCYGITDVGRRRPTNQDHFLVADLNKSMRVHGTSLNLDDETRIYGGSQGKLLIVADGMGGEAEGERASTIAVDQVTTYVLNSLSWCFRLEEDSEHDFEDHLKEALESCQKSIQAVVGQHPEMKSMGTTMTMVYIVWPRAFVVHVGDSRCYLLRERQARADHHRPHDGQRPGASRRNEPRRRPPLTAWATPCGTSSAAAPTSCPSTSTNSRSSATTRCCSAPTASTTWSPTTSSKKILEHRTSVPKPPAANWSTWPTSGGKDNITLIVSHFLAPQLDEPRAFVEAEVPLEQLTIPPRHRRRRHRHHQKTIATRWHALSLRRAWAEVRGTPLIVCYH